MKLSPFFIVFILLIIHLLPGESLWDPGFMGFISSQGEVAQGDVLVVLIDTSFSLSHVSTQKDSKTITFEYTGGEYGDLFSFLPGINTGADSNIKGDEKYSFKSEMVVRMVSLEDNEHGYVEGSREITIDGKKESITLTGYINIKDINQQKQIPFSKIADSRLVFQTFLYPDQYILTENDLEEIVQELAAETEGMAPVETPPPEGGISEATATAAPVVEGVPAESMIKQTRISKEKKMELFLKYVNRMIDFLFQ